MTAAAAPVTVVAAARTAAAAMTWTAPSLLPTAWGKGQSRSAGAVRWYSGSAENQVPGSRIWGFDEIKTLVEKKDPKEKVIIVGMSHAFFQSFYTFLAPFRDCITLNLDLLTM